MVRDNVRIEHFKTRSDRRTGWAVWLQVLVGGAGCGGPATWRAIADPAGDDHGPGSYAYPQSTIHRPGAYDLREVRLGVQGDELVVEAWFGRPVVVARGVRVGSDAVADLFVPTVDLYLDLDLVRGRGALEGLFGRRVLLADDLGWEVAIVLTALPTQVRRALPVAPAGTELLIPERVQVRGATLRARLPAGVLKGRDPAQIGVAASVGSSVFLASFKTLLEKEGAETGLLREITEEPGRCGDWEELADGSPCTFGGAGASGHHPRVLDALHPDSGAQERALAHHDDPGGSTWARLPVVVPQGHAVLEETPRTAPILAREGGTLTFQVSGLVPAGLKPGALLEALDAGGTRVARVAVISIHPGGVGVATVAEGTLEAAVSVRLP
jgi:hypothetical protein